MNHTVNRTTSPLKRFLRRSRALLTAAALSLTAVFCAPAQLAEAYSTADNLSSGCYVISPKCAPGSCLDMSGAGTDNGVNLQIWGIAGVDQQRFQVTATGSGSYWITAVHSGRRLDIDGPSRSSGANIHQWDAHNGNSQKWYIKYAGNGYYTIQSVYSGKFLDVSGGGSGNGTNVWQYDGNGTAAQLWRFEEVLPSNGIYTISPQCAPGSVLDISGGSTQNGANLQIWQNANVNQQKFTLARVGSGNCFTITAVHSGRRLDIADQSTGSGANIHQWDAHNGSSQQWRFCYQGGNRYAIQSVRSSKYLDVSGGDSGNGTNVWQYDGNGTAAQRFTLTGTSAVSGFQSYSGTVTARTGLNMRSAPSSSGSKLTAIPYNTTVTITAEQNGWGKTSYGGKTGWVSLQYISKGGTVIPTPASGYRYPFDNWSVTCAYGKKGSWKCGYHSGLDLVPTDGNWDIKAIHSGTIVRRVSNDKSYGNYVIVDHGDGYLSLYAHMSSFGSGISTGKTVAAGQKLGVMGQTGNASGAHLHLEIHKGGYRYPATIDPAAFLKERV